MSVISEMCLTHASRFVEARLGLNFPQSRWFDLERGLIGAARDMGLPKPEDIYDVLQQGPSRSELEILASHLTVGETYFFREPSVFDALERHVLPELIRRRAADRRLRIWSAGCCTGEEPYSIAILLDRLIPSFESWNVSILATDINPHFLRRAASGVYKDWSFRDPGLGIKERYFQPHAPGHYELAPHIRSRVSFAHLNLAEDSFPSLANATNAMDLIFCRNVLMYFSPDQIHATIDRFHRSLVDGGNLVVSTTEVSQQYFRAFSTTRHKDAIFYAKGPADPAKPVAHLSPLADFLALPSSSSNRSLPARPFGETRPKPAAARPPVAHLPTAPVPSGAIQNISALFAAGRYLEAEAAATDLLKREPANSFALAFVARIAANQGNLQKALDWCDRSLAADKMNAATHHLRASILEELGRFADASESLRKTLYLDPRFVLAHYTLGHLAVRERKPGLAAKHFSNVLQLLEAAPPDDEIPGSDGLTAGRLAEMTRSLSFVAH